jgi:large subunit ribosomal protein L25
MDNFKLSSIVRTDVGKGVARKLRAAGNIPGVLYGHKEEAVGLTFKEAEIRSVLHAHADTPIVSLAIEGNKGSVDAVIRDAQRHPATGKLLHIDLQRISLDEKIRVEVHVVLAGVPAGVKEQGGIMEPGTRSLQVMCLPREIPEQVDVNVEELRIHEYIRLKDVMDEYPKVEFLDDPDSTLVTVIPPIVEAEPEEGEEGAAESTEPEVVGEKAETEETSD